MQAKEMAAESLGAKFTPSNYEVALELDRLADDAEGGLRQRRLIDMRKKALVLMKDLKTFNPRLIGSVWRGTARMGSDIDVVVLARSPSDLEVPLANYKIRERREVSFKGGVHAHHFKIDLGEDEAEIVVRDPTEYTVERCDIYGDAKRGLTLLELERLLRTDPLRKFVPKRRSR